MNMQMSELMMSSPHFFPIYLEYNILIYFIFFGAHTYKIMSPCENIYQSKHFAFFRVDIGQVLIAHGWNREFS